MASKFDNFFKIYFYHNKDNNQKSKNYNQTFKTLKQITIENSNNYIKDKFLIYLVKKSKMSSI